MVVGQSEESQFDIGVQLGVFSTSTTHIFEQNWPWFGLALLVVLVAYFVMLSVVYGVKS